MSRRSERSWFRIRRSSSWSSGDGLEAELVGQVGARLLVGPQRLGLPAGAVERQHVLRAEALAHRVLLAQHLELAGELRVPAERELRLDPRLHCRQP